MKLSKFVSVVFVLLFSSVGFSSDLEFDHSEVQVIATCDAVGAKVPGWYVLGRINYSEAKLFFNSLGRYIMPVDQRNMMPLDEGALFEIKLDYLTYHFSFLIPGEGSLMIQNAEGRKIETVPCRLK